MRSRMVANPQMPRKPKPKKKVSVKTKLRRVLRKK